MPHGVDVVDRTSSARALSTVVCRRSCAVRVAPHREWSEDVVRTPTAVGQQPRQALSAYPQIILAPR